MTKYPKNWHNYWLWELNIWLYVKLTLLLLSHFSRVPLYTTPQTAAHQPPPSLRFSRQEHWSGLPFPSPMHETERWKWGRSIMSDSERPHGLQPTRLLHPWDFPGKSTGAGCHCLLQGTILEIFNVFLRTMGWHRRDFSRKMRRSNLRKKQN